MKYIILLASAAAMSLQLRLNRFSMRSGIPWQIRAASSTRMRLRFGGAVAI